MQFAESIFGFIELTAANMEFACRELVASFHHDSAERICNVNALLAFRKVHFPCALRVGIEFASQLVAS